MARLARGGAPIKLRIVKGANLAMERIDAAWHGWPQAPYTSKAQVDANYKRMVNYGMRPEHACAVHLGIASHNLFDVAYGLLLRAQHGVEAMVEFEMLEGMANHQARAVQETAGGLLLYAPVVKQQDFHSAIAYLVRRFDENTDPATFCATSLTWRWGTRTGRYRRTLF
jgi:RHH-type proline utilization regulon transcriptional repressor/proline dehydrogenase/delta 1-pyrroline-5-carboxylate dehydrogenase